MATDVDPSSVRGILTGKVGGVPVWLVGIVGIGGLAWYIKRKGSGSDTQADTTDTGVMGGMDGQMPYSGATFITVPGPSSNASSTPTPTTNPTPPKVIATNPIGGAPRPSSPVIKTGGSPPKQITSTYRVQKGDTLTSIASRLHISLATLESLNSAVIQATAKKHGVAKNFNNYIYPGEPLVYPKAG